MVDWSTCPEVERNPDRAGGAWTFRGTRLPVAALFDNLAAGATVAEFLAWFQGVTPGQVDAALTHVSRSVEADGPVPIDDGLADELRRRLERYRADPGNSLPAEQVRKAGYEAARRASEARGSEVSTRVRAVFVRRTDAAGSTVGPIETRPFDAARYLATPEDAAAYLEAALGDGDVAVVATALAGIARSENAARTPLDADATDQDRAPPTEAGGSGLATLLAVTKALGLELRVRPTSGDPVRPDHRSPSLEPTRGAAGPVISRDPEIMSGTPAFAGTRVPIKAAFDYLEAGDSVENFLDDYPGVSPEQLTRMLELARVSLLGPDGPAVRPIDPKRRPRKVRYGGRELEVVPANGVTGTLLSSFDRTWTFRVTREDGTSSDYRLRHDGLTVTIADDELAALYSDGDEIGILDHSPEVLGLIPGAPRTVFHTERRPARTDERDIGREILDGMREIKTFDRGEGPTLRTRHPRRIDAAKDGQCDGDTDFPSNS